MTGIGAAFGLTDKKGSSWNSGERGKSSGRRGNRKHGALFA